MIARRVNNGSTKYYLLKKPIGKPMVPEGTKVIKFREYGHKMKFDRVTRPVWGWIHVAGKIDMYDRFQYGLITERIRKED